MSAELLRRVADRLRAKGNALLSDGFTKEGLSQAGYAIRSLACREIADEIIATVNDFESGANAAANSPALCTEASPTRTGNTIGDGNHG